MPANSLVLSLFSERVDLSDEPTPAGWLALGTTSGLLVARYVENCSRHSSNAGLSRQYEAQQFAE
jgi:hypothetical protein